VEFTSFVRDDPWAHGWGEPPQSAAQGPASLLKPFGYTESYLPCRIEHLVLFGSHTAAAAAASRGRTVAYAECAGHRRTARV
jgi:hypothetical protein